MPAVPRRSLVTSGGELGTSARCLLAEQLPRSKRSVLNSDSPSRACFAADTGHEALAATRTGRWTGAVVRRRCRSTRGVVGGPSRWERVISQPILLKLGRAMAGAWRPLRVWRCRNTWNPMSVRFDHVAVAARDKQPSALFLCNLLGLPDPDSWGPFVSVRLDDGVHLDYAEPGIEFPGQHYALLVTEDVFDHTLAAIEEQGLVFSAGPKGPRAKSTTTTAAAACTSTNLLGITSN